jgi:uncharacterized protein (DUF2235 family)
MRHLVIGTDGTWNKPDQMDRYRQVPSNVVKILRAADENSREVDQHNKYYDTGVGTGGWRDKLYGGATGHGLYRNMVEAYRWLIETHKPEDRLFLFGFSRGAFTVRSLAGMLDLCGIPKSDANAKTLADEAAKIYKMKRKDARQAAAKRFYKKYNSAPGSVHFLGVWDTVGALGLPTAGPLGWWSRRRYRFHDVSLGGNIRHAFHALAIHERRAPFRPALWQGEKPAATERAVQCWFPGVHSNVGGGYADAGLADRALLWMIRRAEEAGLRTNQRYIEKRIDPNWFGELRDSMNWFYRSCLAGCPANRPIKTGALGEHLHFSVLRRWSSASSPDRMPANVEAALKANIDVWENAKEERFHDP